MTPSTRSEILLTLLILSVSIFAGGVGYSIGRSMRDWQFVQVRLPIDGPRVDCYVRAHERMTGR